MGSTRYTDSPLVGTKMSPREAFPPGAHRSPKVTSSPGIVVDLFCGAGGLTHGFRKEGFEVAAGIDADESCLYASGRLHTRTGRAEATFRPRQTRYPRRMCALPAVFDL